jgi:hypothetical protein
MPARSLHRTLSRSTGFPARLAWAAFVVIASAGITRPTHALEPPPVAQTPPAPPSAVRPPSARFGVLSGLRVAQDVFGLTKTIDGYTVSSELEWPAQFVLAGLFLRLPLSSGPELMLQAQTNLTDTAGTMNDSDFIADSSRKVKFAYTESETRARGIYVDVGLLIPRSPTLDLVLGYRHEYYSADAYGYEGWALAQSGDHIPISSDDDSLAGHREAHYFLPYAGLRYLGRYEGRLLGGYAKDFDDHVLRKKHGYASSGGLGLSLMASPITTERFALTFELHYLTSFFGHLTQKFYGDDPGTRENDTGMKFESDYFTRRLMASVTLSVGLF